MLVYENMTETILDFPDKLERLTLAPYQPYSNKLFWTCSLYNCGVISSRCLETPLKINYTPEVYIGQLMFLNLIERFLET